MEQKALGQRIRELRKVRYGSTQEFADAAKMDRANATRLELGQTDPRYSTLRRVAKALGTKVDRLVRE